MLRDDRDDVLVDGEEATVDLDRATLARGRDDDDVALDEHGKQGLVTGQDADLTFGGAGDQTARFAFPDLTVGGDELDVQVAQQGDSSSSR